MIKSVLSHLTTVWLCAAFAGSLIAQPSPKVWTTYHDYANLSQTLRQLGQAYPRLVRVSSLGTSVQGRDIWLVTISSRQSGASVPEVLFDGAMHGSEVISAESILAYARYLLENYNSDPAAREIVDGTRTYLIPMVNPDGVEAGKTSRSWKAARKNAHGVNLNRNFDWHWDDAGADDPMKEDYRGPSPFSEPESRIVRDFLESHPILMYLNGHAGENREGHTVTPLHSKDVSRFQSLAAKIEEIAGFSWTKGALAGGAFNWAYWISMDGLRNTKVRPLALALEVYSNPDIEPSSKNWWSRYNPTEAELPDYLQRVRTTFMELTRRAHPLH